ncbi:MAG: MFS transporter [Candidatus Hydrogenedentes bacterium]|nr:MFS transporter [Candidatus Hydrogenedentota bacterium]
MSTEPAASPRNAAGPQRARFTIPYLRWWIAVLLFLMTVINYIDRQTLGALSPFLKEEFKWSNEDYAFLLNSFRVAYTIMQAVFGRILDIIGTQHGLTLSVLCYSIVAAATAFAQGKWSFAAFRFLLGCGEAANNPGGSKVVSEWFPAKERAWAVALFNSGCAIGGALAPFIVVEIYYYFDSWRPAFAITASLGFVWLVLWLLLFRAPEQHPYLSGKELAYIQAGRSSGLSASGNLPHVTWGKLLRYRQTWGIVCGRFLLDPYWFFMAEWFALYLRSKGFSMTESALGFWAPFLGADIGNFFGGAVSSWLIKRGWPVGRSRRTTLLIFGPSMIVLALTAYTNNYVLLLLLFAYTSFAYACCSTMFLTLPTDVFHSRAVGSVMGLGGTGAGLGALLSTYLIGRISESISFEPIILAASIIPFFATLVFVTLVRARKSPDPEGIVLDF